MFVSVIWTGYCLVSTRVRIHRVPSPTKAYSRFRTRAVILLVTHNAILTLESVLWFDIALKPSLLQFRCKEACAPISFFHVLRPIVVVRYTPSAIREKRELAFLCRTMKFISWPSFIPRQILEKGVLQ